MAKTEPIVGKLGLGGQGRRRRKRGPKLRLLKSCPRAKAKIKLAMGHFKDEEMHSGSKKGPIVKNRKQAVAIALNQAKNIAKNLKRKSSYLVA